MNPCEEPELAGVLALLRKYLHYLCCHLLELLPAATATGAMSARHYLAVSGLLDQEYNCMNQKPFL